MMKTLALILTVLAASFLAHADDNLFWSVEDMVAIHNVAAQECVKRSVSYVPPKNKLPVACERQQSLSTSIYLRMDSEKPELSKDILIEFLTYHRRASLVQPLLRHLAECKAGAGLIGGC
jgi:hypothetical protein